MGPWSFWTARANSDPLPVKSREDSNTMPSVADGLETSWSVSGQVYATSAPGGWDQEPMSMPESQPIGQPDSIQPDNPASQPFGRPLVLNRMDSPLQEPEDSVSSVIRGVH